MDWISNIGDWFVSVGESIAAAFQAFGGWLWDAIIQIVSWIFEAIYPLAEALAIDAVLAGLDLMSWALEGFQNATSLIAQVQSSVSAIDPQWLAVIDALGLFDGILILLTAYITSMLTGFFKGVVS